MTAIDPPAGAGSRGCRLDLLILAGLAGLCWLPIAVFSFLAGAALVLWLPGRSIVRLLTPLGSMPARLASALGASLLLVPLYLSPLWMWTNRRPPVLAAIVGLNLVLILLSAGRPSGEPPPAVPARAVRFGLLTLLAYVCTLVFLFYWLPTAFDRVAFSPSGDYIKHHAVLWSLSERPLPLHNPFFADQADAPYYYYHYHYMLPIAARRIAGDRVSLAAAFGFTSALVAGLFITLVFLIARRLLASDAGALLSAVCASVVGGWDILPVAARVIREHRMVVVLDSWSPFPWRIHNVLDNFIWCPQHVAAVVCLLLCAYWLSGANGQRWWFVIAPLAAASIFGTSVYQAMTMFAAVGVWLLLALRTRRGLAPSPRMVPAAWLAVVVALLLLALQAWQYRIMSHRYPGGLTMSWERFKFAFFGRLAGPGVLANLLDAPWLVLLEFGLPGLACLLVTGAVWRDAWRNPGVRLLILAGAIGLVTMFIFRSNTTQIDYAFRAAVMPANVVAAFMAGAMLRADAVRRAVRAWRAPLIVLGCVLGMAVGVYELPAMAMRTVLQNRFQPGEPDVIRFLRDRLPPDAVVQSAPRGDSERVPQSVYLPQVTGRRAGVLDPDNPHVLVLRPPDPQRMYAACDEVEAAFVTGDAPRACEMFRRWGITHVMVGAAERERYGTMPQFSDPTCFEPLYTKADSTVYRLRARPGGRAATGEAR